MFNTNFKYIFCIVSAVLEQFIIEVKDHRIIRCAASMRLQVDTNAFFNSYRVSTTPGNTGNLLEFREISWYLVSPRRYLFLCPVYRFNYMVNRIAVISVISNLAQQLSA